MDKTIRALELGLEVIEAEVALALLLEVEAGLVLLNVVGVDEVVTLLGLHRSTRNRRNGGNRSGRDNSRSRSGRRNSREWDGIQILSERFELSRAKLNETRMGLGRRRIGMGINRFRYLSSLDHAGLKRSGEHISELFVDLGSSRATGTTLGSGHVVVVLVG
jgi:hypothetical protein